jgi:hypothetical protein
MALSLNTIGIPSLFVLSLQSEYYHLSQYPATDTSHLQRLWVST